MRGIRIWSTIRNALRSIVNTGLLSDERGRERRDRSPADLADQSKPRRGTPDYLSADLIHGYRPTGCAFWYQRYVAPIPSRSEIFGVQPSASSRLTSRSLRGVPSGRVVSNRSVPS